MVRRCLHSERRTVVACRLALARPPCNRVERRPRSPVVALVSAISLTRSRISATNVSSYPPMYCADLFSVPSSSVHSRCWSRGGNTMDGRRPSLRVGISPSLMNQNSFGSAKGEFRIGSDTRKCLANARSFGFLIAPLWRRLMRFSFCQPEATRFPRSSSP